MLSDSNPSKSVPKSRKKFEFVSRLVRQQRWRRSVLKRGGGGGEARKPNQVFKGTL